MAETYAKAYFERLDGRGNVMARIRMVTIFDLGAALNALPIGTGNKTERLFGYFTWHADDSPPINPLGDLFKTQVWALARHLGIPAAIVDDDNFRGGHRLSKHAVDRAARARGDRAVPDARALRRGGRDRLRRAGRWRSATLAARHRLPPGRTGR